MIIFSLTNAIKIVTPYEAGINKILTIKIIKKAELFSYVESKITTLFQERRTLN